MNRWPTKPLGEVATDLQPGFACRPSQEGTGSPQIRPLNLTNNGSLIFEGTKTVPCSIAQLRRYQLRKGDVLFNNTNSPELVGKVAIVTGAGQFVFSNHITRIRLREEQMLPRFLNRFLFKAWTEGYFQRRCTQWVNQAAINVEALSRMEIPAPPLAEQERIVNLLDEADELRKLRAQADRRTAELIPALFNEMFVTSQAKRAWPVFPLGGLVKFVGGGTPSRARPDFFEGTIPWATSKDVKTDYMGDAQEHITNDALGNSAANLIPAGSVLVVVKSKILMHSLPVAITTVPMCFGQDLKGLVCGDTVTPEFIASSLRTKKDTILAQARGANTEGLTLDILRAVQISLPPMPLQRGFAQRVAAIRKLEASQAIGRTRLDTLFQSMLQSAFNQQLLH